jgi:VanZ family protein
MHPACSHVVRRLCVAYWFALTLLLLLHSPTRLLGGRPQWVSAYQVLEPGLHMLSFLILAALVMAARFPLRPLALAAILILYAAVTELMQWLVPGRTPSLADFYQDLFGLAAGTALIWLARRCTGRRQAVELVSASHHVPDDLVT